MYDVASGNTIGTSLIGQFFHREWQGLNLGDLIQPAFMMMVDVAMVYSSQKQIQNGTLWKE
ncbi:MAG: hypothetical protein Q4C98_07120 [Capnocytophaga sp.]|nr:hypothetical protein [Capnocytophaga sp.]